MNNELFLLIQKIGDREYNRKIIFSNAKEIYKGICERVIIIPNSKKLLQDYINYREEVKKKC